MITLKDLQEKVEKGISDYIEFDVKEIFKQSDYITIYGGAVRDSLAGLEIHDIDILCMPESASKLRKFLHEHDYESLDLFDQDALNMYHGISLISEPWTLMNKNKKIIQIIRPTWKSAAKNKMLDSEDYKDAYYNLIKNVDLSCCGVFLDNDQNNDIILKEACKNAIIHCLSMVYKINKWSLLYNSDRTMYREHKLSSRGWIDLYEDDDIFYIHDKKKIQKSQRRFKIYNLEFKPEYDYKVWTEEEYSNRPKDQK